MMCVILPYTGTQAAMVCQALVSIATHAQGTWEYAAPALLKYLESKTEDHDEVLVSSMKYLLASSLW